MGAVRCDGVDLSYICIFFFQAEDGIRDLVRSRGLGDVYKRQTQHGVVLQTGAAGARQLERHCHPRVAFHVAHLLPLSLIHI